CTCSSFTTSEDEYQPEYLTIILALYFWVPPILQVSDDSLSRRRRFFLRIAASVLMMALAAMAINRHI
ncbi:hypothetical protein A2U01_0066884, partial [Trifolium medium]|nr:hypothetical protein [Trifolium medium]